MTDPRAHRYFEAYLPMAAIGYRPMANTDDLEDRDPALLRREAVRYAQDLIRSDDERDFNHLLGCPDFAGIRAFCLCLEAADQLCGPYPEVALALLQAAARDITAEFDLAKRTAPQKRKRRPAAAGTRAAGR